MSNRKIGFVSLGCPKALVDSERILTQLKTDGYEITDKYDDANVVVVNTCGFIDSAKQESLDSIGEAIDKNGKVIVTGCLGKYEDEIKEHHPSVLNISGPQQYETVLNAVHEYAPIDKTHDPFIDIVPPQGIKLTPRHYAYLKISEGCNHNCSFCIIPSMRGRLNSRKAEDLLDEAKCLVDSGVKELLIISQDTSAYGSDLKYKTGFWNGRPVKSRLFELCQELSRLDVWVRLHYVYPYPHVDELIPLMADGKLLPYLDIPFQHSSTKILKSMRRPAATEKTLERIQKWRSICPDIVIRSTFIVGFPGETEQDFEHLLDFLEEARLDRVGCFKYSDVKGAQSNSLESHVPEHIKDDRWDHFMQTQAKISTEKLQQRVGQIMEVLIDTVDDTIATGRTYADAPEIDGEVYFKPEAGMQAGQKIKILVNKADEYDLYGSIL